jgi:transposase
VDAYGRVVRALVTSGTTADCTVAIALFDGIDNILALLADKAYDVNYILEKAREMGIEICIPSKKNRKQQRKINEEMYKFRHIVENVFLMLKRWRGIATRYAKNTDSYVAGIQIKCLHNFLRLSTKSCVHTI